MRQKPRSRNSVLLTNASLIKHSIVAAYVAFATLGKALARPGVHGTVTDVNRCFFVVVYGPRCSVFLHHELGPKSYGIYHDFIN
jgi:hypothetical protein